MRGWSASGDPLPGVNHRLLIRDPEMEVEGTGRRIFKSPLTLTRRHSLSLAL
jgi:hypothetical protein